MSGERSWGEDTVVLGRRRASGGEKEPREKPRRRPHRVPRAPAAAIGALAAIVLAWGAISPGGDGEGTVPERAGAGATRSDGEPAPSRKRAKEPAAEALARPKPARGAERRAGSENVRHRVATAPEHEPAPGASVPEPEPRVISQEPPPAPEPAPPTERPTPPGVEFGM